MDLFSSRKTATHNVKSYLAKKKKKCHAYDTRNKFTKGRASLPVFLVIRRSKCYYRPKNSVLKTLERISTKSGPRKRCECVLFSFLSASEEPQTWKIET